MRDELLLPTRKSSILPSAESLEIAPITTTLEEKDLHLQAIRRQKVRELRDMGYGPIEIHKVIKKGILINEIPYFTDVTLSTIKDDTGYLMQEDLAADVSFPEKKAAIVSKYNLLYRQALHDYATTKGQSRVSFLNTAKTILDKLTELEGIAAPKVSFEKKTIEHTKASSAAKEVNEDVDKKQRDTLITTIEGVLTERHRGRIGGVSMATKAPRVRASSSKDGEVSN